MDVTSNGEVDVNSQNQDAMTKLRVGFLKTIAELTGQPCKILTYEQSELPAKFSGWHPDGTQIIVTDFKTPAFNETTSALLRVPDVLAVKFDNNLQLTETVE